MSDDSLADLYEHAWMKASECITVSFENMVRYGGFRVPRTDKPWPMFFQTGWLGQVDRMERKIRRWQFDVRRRIADRVDPREEVEDDIW